MTKEEFLQQVKFDQPTVVAIRRMEGKRLMLHSPQRKAG